MCSMVSLTSKSCDVGRLFLHFDFRSTVRTKIGSAKYDQTLRAFWGNESAAKLVTNPSHCTGQLCSFYFPFPCPGRDAILRPDRVTGFVCCVQIRFCFDSI